MEKTLKLFVPGRLCLFGEHSDWASLHRVMNSAIVPGHAIVTGVEQGIYATVSMADKFIVESELASFNISDTGGRSVSQKQGLHLSKINDSFCDIGRAVRSSE